MEEQFNEEQLNEEVLEEEQAQRKEPYKKERRYLAKGAFWTALIILILLLLFTSTLLALRFADYITVDNKEVQLQTNMDADIDMFRVEYKNASGEITVVGADDQKVVAPGTSVEYTIRLRNNDRAALDYMLTPKFTQTPGYEIPILVRMIGPDGKYVIGTNIDWVPISQLPQDGPEGTLNVEQSAEYIFQWKWAFESGNDEYDTFLGSAAVDKDIFVHAVFGIYAMANTQIATGGGLFSTSFGKLMLLVLFIFLLLLAILLLLLARERSRAADRREKKKLDEYLNEEELEDEEFEEQELDEPVQEDQT